MKIFCDYKKNSSSNKPKVRNHNFFLPLQRYDIECYKCNNHGHIERDCNLMTSTEKTAAKELQNKKIYHQNSLLGTNRIQDGNVNHRGENCKNIWSRD